MVIGVTDGFRKGLEINGVGYRAQLVGSKLQLNLGYSHPIEIDPPDGHHVRGRDPRPPGRRRHRQGARRPRRRARPQPRASPSRTRARASATRASSPPQGRQGGQDRRQEVTLAPVAQRRAHQAPHTRIRLTLSGIDRAAAPGGLPQPEPDLRPGHRRLGRSDAGQRLVARDGRAQQEGQQDRARQGRRPRCSPSVPRTPA